MSERRGDRTAATRTAEGDQGSGKGMLKINVTGGIHSGAEIRVPAAGATIGANPENDIVLLSGTEAAFHAVIRRGSGRLPRIRVEAVDRPVQIIGGPSVRSGHFGEYSLPVSLDLGGSILRVESGQSTWLRRVVVVSGVALMLGGFIYSTGMHVRAGTAMSVFSAQPSIALVPTVQNGSLQPPAQLRKSLGAEDIARTKWLPLLAERLDAAKLTPIVRIEATDDAILASGALDDAAMEQWRGILKWYDSEHGAPTLVNNVSQNQEAFTLPQIRSVWHDRNAEVTLADGRRLTVGDFIVGAWRIEAIERQALVLSRGNARKRVTF